MGKAEITVIVLNYRRPENIGLIIDRLRKQSAAPRIWVVDNADEAGNLLPVSVGIDGHATLRRNFGCFARWWFATQVETPFVAVHDDDLVLADDEVLADAMRIQRDHAQNGIVGFFGWQAVPGRSYRGAKHINGATEDHVCDVIKGRFMVLQARLIARIWTGPPVSYPNTEIWRRCDDIYVSLAVSGGVLGRHMVPGILGKRWRELGRQDERALASDPNHYDLRDLAVETMRAHYAQAMGPAA